MASRLRTPAVARFSDREKDEFDATVATQIMGWNAARDGRGWALLNPAGQVVHRVPDAAAAGADGSAESADGQGPAGGDGDGQLASDGSSDGDGSAVHVLPAVRAPHAARASRAAPGVRPQAAAAVVAAATRPPDFAGYYGRYTREMSWAMTVVEAVVEAHRDRDCESPDEVLFRLEWVPGRWRATFLLPREVSVEAETDAVAICLAACEVMRVG